MRTPKCCALIDYTDGKYLFMHYLLTLTILLENQGKSYLIVTRAFYGKYLFKGIMVLGKKLLLIDYNSSKITLRIRKFWRITIVLAFLCRKYV